MKAPSTADEVLGSRRGRIAFGAILCLGAVVVGVIAFMNERQFDREVPFVFGCIWIAALLGGALVRRLPSRLPAVGAGPASPVSAGGSAAADRARALGVASVAAPLFGVAMMAPLTLHAGFTLLVDRSFDGFAGWIAISVVLTLHAHLALGLHAIHFARELEEHNDPEPYPSAAKGARGALVAMLVSLVPGALALLIPPFLVWITGLAFAPFAYHVVGQRFEAERAVLG